LALLPAILPISYAVDTIGFSSCC